MELKEGRINLKDLALWYGKSEKYFSNASAKAKEKFFKIFETYAEYHWEDKKIYIDKVYYPIYTKAFDIIEEEFPKRWGKVVDKNKHMNLVLKKERIDTCARVGSEIWHNNAEVQSQIELKTAKNYTNQIKVKQYGHNHLDDHGTHGRSEYVWMNKEGNAPLNLEELKILQDCCNEAYSSINTLVAAIDADFRTGNLTKEERNKAVGEIQTEGCYDKFVSLLKERLGFIPEKRTRLIDTVEWN